MGKTICNPWFPNLILNHGSPYTQNFFIHKYIQYIAVSNSLYFAVYIFKNYKMVLIIKRLLALRQKLSFPSSMSSVIVKVTKVTPGLEVHISLQMQNSTTISNNDEIDA